MKCENTSTGIQLKNFRQNLINTKTLSQGKKIDKFALKQLKQLNSTPLDKIVFIIRKTCYEL